MSFTQFKFKIVVIWELNIREERDILEIQIQEEAGECQIEEGEKHKEKREGRRRRETKNHLGPPLRKRGDIGWALWPYGKSASLKKWLASL